MSAHNLSSGREKKVETSAIFLGTSLGADCRAFLECSLFKCLVCTKAMAIQQQIRWQMNFDAVLKEKLLSSMIDPARPPRQPSVPYRWGGRVSANVRAWYGLWSYVMEQFFMVQDTKQKSTQIVSSPVVPGFGFQPGTACLQIKPNVALIHLAGKSISSYLAVALRQPNQGG